MSTRTPEGPSRRLLELFASEAEEHLETLNTALLVLEETAGAPVDAASDDARAELSRALRAAHSLKGTAGAAGIPAVEVRMHNWESCLKALASGQIATSAAHFELLYRGLDDVEAEVVAATTGERPGTSAPPPTLQELVAAFGADRGFRPTGVDRAADRPTRPEPAEEAPASRPPDSRAPDSRAPDSKAPDSRAPRSGAEADGTPADGERVSARGPAGAEASTLRVSTVKVHQLLSLVEELGMLRAGDAEAAERLERLTAELTALHRRTARRAPTRASDGHAAESLRTLWAGVATTIEGLEGVVTGLRRRNVDVGRVVDRLDDGVRSVRMVPVESAVPLLTRAVRDAAARLGRRASLEVVGATTEIDRDVLDAVRDPLLHLLRNAVAHGVEAPEARAAAGKPPDGRVTLRAAPRAGGIDLSVSDDGSGIDSGRVRRRALELGLVDEAEAESMSDEEAHRLLFAPGFTTTRVADELSGRGVGLDVVRSAVEALGGRVTVTTAAGCGTTFTLRLPLHLATLRMLLVRTRGRRLAIPTAAVERVLRVSLSDILPLADGSALVVDGRSLSAAELGAVLALPPADAPPARLPGLILHSGADRAVVLVDVVDGEQELVAKPLGDVLSRVPNVAGATVLGSGEIVPVLSVGELLRALRGAGRGAALSAPTASTERRRRVLVVDDSLTTRTLEKGILESVGYEVETAVDGVDGFAKLEQGTFDVVLSDIQMPRMDGIALVTRIKGSERHRHLPVILMSSLGSDDDRRRGLLAGADAYLVKGEFQQDRLLATLERLL